MYKFGFILQSIRFLFLKKWSENLQKREVFR